jgi:hypothetical protein
MLNNGSVDKNIINITYFLSNFEIKFLFNFYFFKKMTDKGFNKEIARAMTLYITYSVLGPLLIIGGLGYLIDKLFNSRFALFFSIFVAFIVSNFLMFKKLQKINKEIGIISPVEKSSDEKKNAYDDEEDEEIWPVNNKK